jgi:hypothetical protein
VTDVLQAVAVAVSAALLLVVLELVRRRKLREEYSFIWLGCAIALLLLSLWRDILHVAARELGVYYPPAVLLLVLILFVFVTSLYFSVVISRQRHQIETLVEELALLDAGLRALRESGGTVTSSEVMPGTAADGGQSSKQGNVGRR